MLVFFRLILYTVLGTLISVSITVLAAYPLSRKELRGKKFFNWLFLFTMMFSGGMIPKSKGLEAAIKAGVKKAVMIDGRIEHSILIEIFSDEGIGTMFTK